VVTVRASANPAFIRFFLRPLFWQAALFPSRNGDSWKGPRKPSSQFKRLAPFRLAVFGRHLGYLQPQASLKRLARRHAQCRAMFIKLDTAA